MLRRPGLIDRVREEVSRATIIDDTGKLTLDVPKLVSDSPLLTSIYLECLRIRTSVTLTRQLNEDIECDGYLLKKGSYIMSPSQLPNTSPIWDVPGHPAKSFWPERFIEMPKFEAANPGEKSQYELAMRAENFFPYGGGNMMCTGRFFAKQEILAAVALLVLKFDIEVEGWQTFDGKRSDIEAGLADGYAGAGVIPPDRDMVVKMRRLR
jgi:cytochrome P450